MMASLASLASFSTQICTLSAETVAVRHCGNRRQSWAYAEGIDGKVVTEKEKGKENIPFEAPLEGALLMLGRTLL